MPVYAFSFGFIYVTEDGTQREFVHGYGSSSAGDRYVLDSWYEITWSD